MNKTTFIVGGLYWWGIILLATSGCVPSNVPTPVTSVEHVKSTGKLSTGSYFKKICIEGVTYIKSANQLSVQLSNDSTIVPCNIGEYENE